METNFSKLRKIVPMATLLLLSFAVLSCSKDDDGPKEPDTRLALPATVENLSAFPIPDATPNSGNCGIAANLGSVVSAIEITADGIISDPSKVTIQLDIAHTWAGDVIAELICPNGESCALIKRINSTTDVSCSFGADFIAGNKLNFNSSFTNTTLTNPISTGDYAQLTGISPFPTSIPMPSLGNFLKDKNIKGTWKIKIYDSGVGDIGTLKEWKLKFDTGALK